MAPLPIAFLLLTILTFSSLPISTRAQSSSSPAPSPSPNSAHLRVLVPLKTGFTEFVSWSGTRNNATFDGLSIEVFERAVMQLPSPFTYEFVPFGDGNSTPVYDDMIQKLVDKEVDAVAADLTITKERMEKVDFTQPYIQSTLQVVVALKTGGNVSLWDFLQPFSVELWLTILSAFIFTGIVIFILEPKNSDFDEGTLCTRLSNVFWFTSLTIFFSQREGIKSNPGRVITIFWLLVVLIFQSSYTANLTSTLTAKLPSSEIQGIDTLQRSNVPVGYHEGSFTKDYLERLGIRAKRLKSLASEQDFATALTSGPNKGGVAAIVDESPYVQTFLASECNYFTTVGNEIVDFGGFGFAFPKNSSLTVELSMAILSLAQSGDLNRIRDSWMGGDGCSSDNVADHLRLKSFGGLFIILLAVYIICVLWHIGAYRMKSKQREVRPAETSELEMNI